MPACKWHTIFHEDVRIEIDAAFRVVSWLELVEGITNSVDELYDAIGSGAFAACELSHMSVLQCVVVLVLKDIDVPHEEGAMCAGVLSNVCRCTPRPTAVEVGDAPL